MRCESLFNERVLRGMTTTKKDEQTTDDLTQHPLPLVSCFLGLGQINPQSPFYSSISEETKAHDEHTRARSLTHTHHHIYIHTYIINK